MAEAKFTSMEFQASRKLSDCNNAIEQKVVTDIERDGWSLMAIFGEDGGPGHVYTVGLEHSFEHPELTVFGLPIPTAAGLLNEMGDQVRGGRRFSEGQTCDDLGINAALQIGSVSKTHYAQYLCTGSWFYRGDDYRILQVIWPDRFDRFPDNPKFEKRFRKDQPLLSLPKSEN